MRANGWDLEPVANNFPAKFGIEPKCAFPGIAPEGLDGAVQGRRTTGLHQEPATTAAPVFRVRCHSAQLERGFRRVAREGGLKQGGYANQLAFQKSAQMQGARIRIPVEHCGFRGKPRAQNLQADGMGFSGGQEPDGAGA